MPKQAATVSCTSSELAELNTWLKAGKTESRMKTRASIVLLCHEKKSNTAIADILGLGLSSVKKWRKRFIDKGISGLRDAPRSGKPRAYTSVDRANVLELLKQPAPKGQSTWDGGAIAKELKMSKDSVWRILRQEGIQLQRMRSWCISTDKEFSAKAADVIGLYLNPPENALVLSVDEKPSIQALARKWGYVKTSSKKIVQGLQSTYKRNGTLNLFAALNVATGRVQTKTTPTKKRPDFQAFMDDVLKDIPNEQEVHVILDNYATHKKNDAWLEKHPNVYFHFTPTSASWLNQIEIWFGILTRKALRGASFSSIEQLKIAIEDFVEAYHVDAKPFVWRKREVKGSQFRDSAANFCN